MYLLEYQYTYMKNSTVITLLLQVQSPNGTVTITNNRMLLGIKIKLSWACARVYKTFLILPTFLSCGKKVRQLPKYIGNAAPGIGQEKLKIAAEWSRILLCWTLSMNITFVWNKVCLSVKKRRENRQGEFLNLESLSIVRVQHNMVMAFMLHTAETTCDVLHRQFNQ